MPGTWTPDLIEGAELEVGSQGQFQVVSGCVPDLDYECTEGNGHEVLRQLFTSTGWPGLGSQLPGYPDLILAKVRAFAPAPWIIRALLYYSSVNFGGTPTAAFIRTRTEEQLFSTQFVPGMNPRVPIVNGFIDSNNPARNQDLRGVDVTMSRSVRVLEISGLTAGEPTIDAKELVNKVNDDDWPVDLPNETPKPRAYWKCTHYETNLSRYTGYTSYSACVASLLDEDWSAWHLLRHINTGVVLTTQQDFQNADAPEYVHGIIYPVAVDPPRGLVRIGPHKVASFPAVFSF